MSASASFPGMDGGPAFPVIKGDLVNCRDAGMTLRDYFAAAALPGVMGFGIKENAFDAEAIADDAYRVADAMLAHRKNWAAAAAPQDPAPKHDP